MKTDEAYPKLIVNEPDSKSLHCIWNMLDQYIEVALKRFYPSKTISHIKELQAKTSEQWSQSQLDYVANMLVEDIIGVYKSPSENLNEMKKQIRFGSPRKCLFPNDSLNNRRK